MSPPKGLSRGDCSRRFSVSRQRSGQRSPAVQSARCGFDGHSGGRQGSAERGNLPETGSGRKGSREGKPGREAGKGSREGKPGREAAKGSREGKPRTDFPEDFPAHFGAFCHRAPSRALRAERAVEVSRWLFPEASPAHSEVASAGLPIRLPGIQSGSIPNSPNIIPPASPHRRKPQIRIPERMPLQVPKPQAQPPSHHSLDPIRLHSRAPATPKSGSSAPP